jgi:sirohydrochlorin ferrochelatase
MPRLLLIDNGSSRADSTRTLRRLAAALAARLDRPVDPVSLMHADKVPADALDGRPAETLAAYLRRAAAEGTRDFLAVPLFFGPSRALSRFVPETAAALTDEVGAIEVRVARELCPLPDGEPRLATILADHVRATAAGAREARVVLVDHGSPIPEVTAVRRWLANRLEETLGRPVTEAVMERREGREYDFNGPLLDQVLTGLVAEDTDTPIVVAMLFLAPGRHAGEGGDIAGIIAGVRDACPGVQIEATPLVAGHEALIDILADRAREAGVEGAG